VHGDPLKDRIVAVVVPDEEALQAWWDKNGPKTSKRVRPSSSAVQPIGAGEAGPFACLCQNKSVVEAVLHSLEREAKKKNSKLASYEIPLAIYLEPEPWLPDSGLVTPTLKLKRLKLREHYKHVIARLYTPNDDGADDGSPGQSFQATKKEEDRVGGDQGIRVPEEVVDEFPNFEAHQVNEGDLPPDLPLPGSTLWGRQMPEDDTV